MIALTENASAHIQKLMAKQGLTEGGLRVGIKGGGCSGLSYTFSWERGADALANRIAAWGAAPSSMA